MWPFKKKKVVLNPEDFRLKISKAWSGVSDYIQFEYSTDAGRKWKSIQHASPPLFGSMAYNWEWTSLVYELKEGNKFLDEKRQFNTYQKILDYEKEEKIKYQEGCRLLEQERKSVEDRKERQIKSLNN